MQDEVIFREGGGQLTAYVKCEIDHHVAGRIRTRIDRMLFERRPQCLVLDFSEVRFMDSSGIALILGRVETAAAVGARVRLTGLSDTLMKLVRLSGIEKIRGLSLKLDNVVREGNER